MSFGKRFFEIVKELEALDTKRDQLVVELRTYVGYPSASAAPKPAAKPAGKPAKRKTPGDLQPLVMKVLGGYRAHKTIDEVFAKVLKTRPNTKKASVGAVLAGLASRGKIVKQADGFFLPADVPGSKAVAPAPAAPPVAPTPVGFPGNAAQEPLED